MAGWGVLEIRIQRLLNLSNNKWHVARNLSKLVGTRRVFGVGTRRAFGATKNCQDQSSSEKLCIYFVKP